jgi:hypothetical protein
MTIGASNIQAFAGISDHINKILIGMLMKMEMETNMMISIPGATGLA